MKAPADYGTRFQDHLVEQYKLYVEMADRVSSRRSQANLFFVSVSSGLLAPLSFVSAANSKSEHTHVLFLVAGIFGLGTCLRWFLTIRSYAQLNSLKFKVVQEIENQLPFPCYQREWQLDRTGGDRRKYLRLTFVERLVPLVVGCAYATLLAYSFVV